MAKRVRRVKRKRGVSRMKAAKEIAKNQGTGAAGPGGAFPPIDPDGPDVHSGSLNLKKMRKGKAGGSGSAELDELGLSEMELDSAASSIDGVTRKGSGGMGQDDGFDQGQKGREAYEAYLKGNVQEDAQRFESLRQKGQVDNFDPDLDPRAVEMLGQLRAANHMVRMYDHWTLDGIDRPGAIRKAAEYLCGFMQVDNVRKVLTELENRPIRDVYPLEVMLEILEQNPRRLPGIRLGSVVGKTPALSEKEVFAGHPVNVPVPKGMRLKAFALLGGLRPGYEFFPSPKKDDQYVLQIDTPGEWDCALFAVQTEALGKMMRETPGGTLERFTVKVVDMGRKEAPATA